MLNIPANIVRKASATVQSVATSTVHTVASVATATGGIVGVSSRRNKDYSDQDILQNAKEKYNLSLKVNAANYHSISKFSNI